MVVQNKVAGTYTIRDLDISLRTNQVLDLDTVATSEQQRGSRDLRFSLQKGFVVALRRALPARAVPVVAATLASLPQQGSVRKAVFLQMPSEDGTFVSI